MEYGFTTAAYVVAAVLFILALGGLSGQESAKRAVWYGIVGMALAVVATLIGPGAGLWPVSLILIAGGAVIGWQVATRVQMTEMPQLVAAMHSLVGLAAVFVGYNAYIEIGRVAAAFAEAGVAFPRPEVVAAESLVIAEAVSAEFRGFAAVVAHKTAVEITILRVEVFLGVFIGAVTFTGSVVAFGKLSGKLTSKAEKLPGGHLLNAAAALASLILLWFFVSGAGAWALILMTLCAFFIGYHLIMGIGGADMPVVVSMLNSYSGWAAAAIGFSLSNDLLIVTGALVGSSGAILSYIMCKAMNRSFVSVILGGFGNTTGPAMAVEGEQVAIEVDGVARPAGGRRQRHHRPRLRHGGGAGAGLGRRADAQAARPGQDRALRHPPRRGAPAGAHERAAGRGQGALRHRARDGRDQRRLPADRRRHRHRLERHREPGGAGGSELARSPGCRCWRSGRPRRSSSPSAARAPAIRGSRTRCSTRRTRGCSTATRRSRWTRCCPRSPERRALPPPRQAAATVMTEGAGWRN